MYRAGRAGAEFPAVRDASVSIRGGESVVLLGRSGSGKTTLLNLIGGIDRPDAGRVVLDGQDTASLDDAALSRLRLETIGFVFQFFNLLPALTARDNVALPLRFQGRSRAGAAAAAEAAARDAAIADRLDRYPHQLSGGEMQRVAIARAIAPRPRLLLADEPTGNLDSENGTRILDLLRQLTREHGVALVLATHDPNAVRIADRVL
ncbi:MAG: ABC transporter ATP-binding protein, partial [Planctomycetes bacterium]|nr:ABC transporter ATP-binding protein [Planctomycetota bacterium]